MSDCEFDCVAGRLPCHPCLETGIGQHGDPDTSKCVSCDGKGSTICSCVTKEREAAAYDYHKERRKERKLGMREEQA